MLSFSAKPMAALVVVPTGVKINPFKAVNPLKANPLKRPNNLLHLLLRRECEREEDAGSDECCREIDC